MGLAQPSLFGISGANMLLTAMKHIGKGEIEIPHCRPSSPAGRAIKVHNDVASLYLDLGLDDDVLFSSRLFDEALGLINAVRDFFDLLPHAFLGEADNLVGQVVQVFEVAVLEHLTYFFGTDVVRRNLGPNVPGNFIGRPYVPSDHINDRLVEHPPVIESYQRNEETFFKDVMVVGGNAAADVGVMKYTGGKGHKLFLGRRWGS